MKPYPYYLLDSDPQAFDLPLAILMVLIGVPGALVLSWFLSPGWFKGN